MDGVGVADRVSRTALMILRADGGSGERCLDETSTFDDRTHHKELSRLIALDPAERSTVSELDSSAASLLLSALARRDRPQQTRLPMTALGGHLICSQYAPRAAHHQ